MELLPGLTSYLDDHIGPTHPVTREWFTMSSPVPTLVVCITYFLLCWQAPSIMQGRAPMELRNAMLVYNAVVSLLSGLVCVMAFTSGFLGGYNIMCQLPDFQPPHNMTVLTAGYLMYALKYVEFLDTLFFVLRKKFQQMSFLHVLHHGVMPFTMWFGIRYSPSGSLIFGPMLNAFVHFLMYFYYAVAALGPEYRKYLWWKKYMTSLQLVQFVLVVLQTSYLVMSDCGCPKVIALMQLSTCGIFFVLFWNFFAVTYNKKKTPQAVNGVNGHACQGGDTEKSTKPISSNGTTHSSVLGQDNGIKED